jgi:glutaredoxin 3
MAAHGLRDRGSRARTPRSDYDRRMVEIFGKDACPYTRAARDHYESLATPVKYHNVKKNPAELDRMLVLSRGKREVPVILEDGKVIIGFGGT